MGARVLLLPPPTRKGRKQTMDEKLQRDIYDLLHQFEFITTAQAQATATGTVPLDEPHSQQPPPPIIVYLVDAPPPEASSDYGNTVDSLAGTDEEQTSSDRAPKDEAANCTSDNDSRERQAAEVVSPLPPPPAAILMTARPRPKGKRVLIVGVLCLVLAAAAMVASLVSFTLVSATITILPLSTEITATSTLTVVTGAANPLHYEVPGRLLAQYISLKPKRGEKQTRKLRSGILPEKGKTTARSFRCTDYGKWTSMTRSVNR